MTLHERMTFVSRVATRGVALATVVLIGCGSNSAVEAEPRPALPTMFVGEAIAGDGREMASVQLIIGEKAGSVGAAFAAGLAQQTAGHPTTLVVLQPNMAVKPSTLLISRVSVTNIKTSIQFHDVVNQGVAAAVVDAVAENILKPEDAENLVIVVTVFIHPEAADNAALFKNNYDAAKLAIQRAMGQQPNATEVEKARRPAS